jgi:hypothetical protein
LKSHCLIYLSPVVTALPLEVTDARHVALDSVTQHGACTSILSEISALSPGKRLHHQRSSRHAMVPLSDTSPHSGLRRVKSQRQKQRMTEKKAKTATPHR